MQPLGVHVGIAAWIDENRAVGGFSVVPSVPVSFTPSAVLPLMESSDVFRQAELVRMANLLPRKGTPAEPFGPGAPLWELMSNVVDQMSFARRPLTDAEADALEAARRVLYLPHETNGLRPSPEYNLYLEMRAVVQALQGEGAPTGLQEQAAVDWLVLGFKNQIEQALADVARLSSRSSVVDAMICRAQLDESMLLSAGEISYAPTSFHPMSAANPATWTVVEVPLADLSDSAARVFPTVPLSLASTSAAQCRFAYAAIETLRPWPVAQLLARDDWKLSSGTTVSVGDGVDGTIPAYVQTLYAASLLGTSATPAPTPRWPTGLGPHPLRAHGLPRASASWGHQPMAPTVPLAPTTARRAGRALGAASPDGVLARVPVPVATAQPPFTGLSQRPRDLALVQRFQVPLNRSEWLGRLAVAEVGRPAAEREPVSSAVGSAPMDLAAGATVVGFGCTTVPPAPNPNAQYQW